MSIPVIQRIVALVFSLFLLGVIVHLIRKRKLREEYALIWLAAGVTIVVFTVFGGLVNLLASALAVGYPPTLILVLGLLFALVILLSQSVTVSVQADRLRDLAQAVALLEHQLDSLRPHVGAGTVDGEPRSDGGQPSPSLRSGYATAGSLGPAAIRVDAGQGPSQGAA